VNAPTSEGATTGRTNGLRSAHARRQAEFYFVAGSEAWLPFTSGGFLSRQLRTVSTSVLSLFASSSGLVFPPGEPAQRDDLRAADLLRSARVRHSQPDDSRKHDSPRQSARSS
jgi:hypothetical protein